ncbi:hypothetical protein [Paenibacillus lautus]|uniref:hypothetical protein n=1 Tax=Paenibacillus lautus TaxID=1401 RepID=UPI00117D3A29|nr:hypothetical protein [Paenibacillus lautus]
MSGPVNYADAVHWPAAFHEASRMKAQYPLSCQQRGWFTASLEKIGHSMSFMGLIIRRAWIS